MSTLPRNELFRNEFDFVVSLGYDCSCAMNLRKLGLRSCSSPFDWLTEADIWTRIKLLETHFADFLEKEHLTKLVKGPNAPGKGNDHYRDEPTGFCFYHDFREDLPFEESYAQVKTKYNRRIDRLYKKISESRHTLWVWRDPAHPLTEQETTEVSNRLAKIFPRNSVSLLVISNDSDFLRIQNAGARAQRRRTARLRLLIRLLSWPHFSRAKRSAARRALEARWGLE